jgi:hypothetical protein
VSFHVDFLSLIVPGLLLKADKMVMQSHTHTSTLSAGDYGCDAASPRDYCCRLEFRLLIVAPPIKCSHQCLLYNIAAFQPRAKRCKESPFVDKEMRFFKIDIFDRSKPRS